MSILKDTVSSLIERWAAFVAREESRWRETLRTEGASGEDVEDPPPPSEGKGCGVKPESPSLLEEAARRKGQVRHHPKRP